MKMLLRIIASGIRWLRRSAVLVLVLGLLALNVATLTSQMVFTALSGAIGALWGGATVAATLTGQIADLKTELDDEKRRHRETRKSLSTSNDDLNKERIKNAELDAKTKSQQVEIDNKKRSINDLELRNEKLSKAYKSYSEDISIRNSKVRQIASRISSRTLKLATVDVASAFGEAIPVIGISVITASTGYDLAETCMTMDDMVALVELFEPTESESEEITRQKTVVCGMKIDSTEIIDRVTSSPEVVWDDMKTWFPDQLPQISLPDFGYLDNWIRSTMRSLLESMGL